MLLAVLLVHWYNVLAGIVADMQSISYPLCYVKPVATTNVHSTRVIYDLWSLHRCPRWYTWSNCANWPQGGLPLNLPEATSMWISKDSSLLYCHASSTSLDAEIMWVTRTSSKTGDKGTSPKDSRYTSGPQSSLSLKSPSFSCSLCLQNGRYWLVNESRVTNTTIYGSMLLPVVNHRGL